MPLYEYKLRSGHQGCPHCRDSFTIEQSIKDDAIAVCPECGDPVERLLFAVGIATPKTNAELKNMGFTKLVRRDHGVYENVTRGEKESRYFEADKPETMPDLKKKIAD